MNEIDLGAGRTLRFRRDAPARYRVVNGGGTLLRTSPKIRGKAARRADKRARRLEREQRERRLARAEQLAAAG